MVLLRDCKVRRGEIAGYLNAEFWTAFRIWKYYRRFGLPNGAGWINEPASTIEIIDLFEDEREAHEAEEIRSRRGGADGHDNNR
jgi:hypothetical protein